MPLSVWAASLELEQGVLTSLSHWISSFFKMLAISLNPKPPHIHPPDADSPPDAVSTAAESLSSFAPTSVVPAPPDPPLPLRPLPPTAATSVSSTPLPPRQESQTPPDMFMKPAVPHPICGGQSHATPNSNKRPKLSLQTSSVPMTFGKSTTALSLTLSAGCSPSPTVRNTFSNAYDGFRCTASLSPVGASSPKSASRSGKRSSSYLCNYQGVDDEIPYKLPLGLRSILRNSPLQTSSLRRPSLAAPSGNGSSNGHNQRKVLFPAKRQVKYRFPLDEEIKTIRYIAKHSDLLSLDSPSGPLDINTSSDESEESDSSLSQPGSCLSDDEDPIASSKEDRRKINLANANNRNTSDATSVKNSNSASPVVQRPRIAKRKHSASERQIRAVALREELSGSGGTHDYRDDTPGASYLHQRRKRPCKWRWTLGPVENGHAQPIDDKTHCGSPNPDASLAVMAPHQQATAPPTAMDVPTLSCPAPRQRLSPLVNTTAPPRMDIPTQPQESCPPQDSM